MWQYKTTDAVIWRVIDHIATLKIEQWVRKYSKRRRKTSKRESKILSSAFSFRAKQIHWFEHPLQLEMMYVPFMHTLSLSLSLSLTHTHSNTCLPQGWGCQDTPPGPDGAAGYGSGRCVTVSPGRASDDSWWCFRGGWWVSEKTVAVGFFSWAAVGLEELGSSYRARMAWSGLVPKTEPHPLHHAPFLLSPVWFTLWFLHCSSLSYFLCHSILNVCIHTHAHRHTHTAISVSSFTKLLHTTTATSFSTDTSATHSYFCHLKHLLHL